MIKKKNFSKIFFTFKALLIGVPEERTSISGSFSHSQTPISTQNSPATILLSSSLSNEKKPLNLVVFCGVTLSSLLELVIYAQCGVPSLVVQVISLIKILYLILLFSNHNTASLCRISLIFAFIFSNKKIFLLRI